MLEVSRRTFRRASALLKAVPHRASDSTGTAQEQGRLAWSKDGHVQTELLP